MCVCAYVCMYVYVCMSIYIYMYVCVCINTHIIDTYFPSIVTDYGRVCERACTQVS